MTSATKREIRQRFKAMREGKPFASAPDHADLLVKLLEPAAESDRAPASQSYVEFIQNRFAARYLELCRVAPVHAKAGAR